MQYLLKTGDPARQRTSCLVAGVFSQRRLSDTATHLDKASKGAISRILKKGDFNGDIGDSLMLYDLPNTACERLLLIGLGEEKEFNREAYLKAVASTSKILDPGGRCSSRTARRQR